MNSNNHSVFDMKFHWVLVTKYGNKCFTKGILHSLESICMSHCAKWGVQLLEFGGESDHMHLMIELNPTIEPSKFINNLKTVSSRLLRKEYNEHLRHYYWKPVLWSRSYCLLTAGGAPLETLKAYIQNQSTPT